MKKTGFTLIEILVTITIITILSMIAITTFIGIPAKARDSVRKEDLTRLALALEIYVHKNGSYITGASMTACQTNPTTSTFYSAIRNYMSEQKVPVDPSNNQAYCYISANGTTFLLCANLENDSDHDANTLCDAYDNLPTTDYNYGVVPK